MKNSIKYIIFTMVCILSIKIVYADDIIVVDDAVGNLHDSLGEVDAQIIKDRFTLDYVFENGDYSFPDSISFNIAKHYTNNDDILENFEADKENGILSYGSNTQFSGRVLTYNDSIVKNTIATPEGTIKLKFKDAIVFSDKTYGDLYLEIDNIKIQNDYKNTTKPISLMVNNMTMISYFALQEFSANAAASDVDKVPSYQLGMTYDVYLYVKKGNQLVDKKMAFIFTDTDQPDSINDGYLDDSGNILPYAESVILKSGVIDNKVHVRNDNCLNIGDTPSGINTRFAGSKNTRDDELALSSFAFLVSTKGFRFGWTSPVAGTFIGLLSTFNIETNSNIPNVTVTPSIENILWKTSKTITITPDEGYHINEIIIDDTKINYQSLELVDNKRTYTNDDVSYTFYENNGNIEYTFNSIIDSHTLNVIASKDDYFNINTETENGKIDSSIEVKKGESIIINYEPLDSYGIEKLIIDGKEFSVKEINENNWNNSYQFDNIISDHSIKVIYTKLENPKTGGDKEISLFLISGLMAGSVYYYIRKKNYLIKI